jgi:hypothetical protein
LESVVWATSYSPRAENEIFRNYDANRPTRSYPNSWLDAEILGDDLLAGLRSVLLEGFADRSSEAASPAKTELTPDTQEARQNNTFDKLPAVPIDAISKTRQARSIARRQVVDTK